MNLELPEVIPTKNENTGKYEVSLAEEIHDDRDNTD
jgi:hypothetical protein